MARKRIALLGSTGSIGKQALEVIEAFPEDFEVEALVAGNNVDLLIEQARKTQPNHVVIANEEHYFKLKDALDEDMIKVFAGREAVIQIMSMDSVDIVLTAMVGFAGLEPTIEAIKSGKRIALANKETLVVAGELIQNLSRQHKAPIIPVDSEHSAIFQCLVGEGNNGIEKIGLTASGGPFREKSLMQMKHVTRQEALNHPNWDMGNKITIDSASLMNKGLEAIEAKWLFNVAPGQIEVVIHPQSIIHSVVQFEDGSIKAQMGLPDMKLPIQYAFSYPKRLLSDFKRFSFWDYPSLDFEKPDTNKFRNLAIAYEAMNKGGNMPCIMNAANEIVVDAFLKDRVTFLEMPDIIEKTMQKASFIADPKIECYIESDQEARRLAYDILNG